MGNQNIDGMETVGASKVLRLLDALRHSQTGNVIYRQVEHLLADIASSHLTIERAYAAAVDKLLNAFIHHLREGSLLQIQVRLLQARLQPPMTASDMNALRDYVDLYSREIGALHELDVEIFQEAISPLLESFGIIESGERQSDAEPGKGAELSKEDKTEQEDESPESTWPFTSPDKNANDSLFERLTGENTRESSANRDKSGQHIQKSIHGKSLSAGNTDNQNNASRLDVQAVQTNFAQQVLETIAQNEEFSVLLEVVLGELRQANDSQEIEDLRWTLIREVDRLLKAHSQLAGQLDDTHHYLEQLESDSRQLSDELSRARMLSMTDELTGLPNRRAFLQRLEDEVARVQRYGFPLALVLIDLDFFKQINDQHGHAGGDEVLSLYSRNVLSMFRHHDLVARYGGEEFAVLLPNTDAEGSMRALQKVMARAAETRWQPNGEMIQVPTFSAGVSLYKPGETASTFIDRADKALYRAKRMGRNRVEMDATYSDSDDAS